jgi:uncharacterized protein YxjI
VNELVRVPTLIIQQKRELAELFGFETRNKYSIESDRGAAIGYAAEQQKGVLGFLLRYFLGHWRPFEIHLFSPARELVGRAIHPFRFFFQRLEVVRADGSRVGAVQQRFAFLAKKFDVEDSMGQVTMRVASPIWRIWTFEFMRQNRVVAKIEKRWGGLLREAFTDADRFRIQFNDPELTEDERFLLTAAAIFVDLQYFERKASSR